MKTDKFVRPLPEYVVLEPQDADTKTDYGIDLPDSAQEKPQLGKIIVIGAIPLEKMIRANADNTMEAVRILSVQNNIQEGDIVAYKKYTGHVIKIKGKEYQVVAFKDLIAVIE